ncbi:MAG: hypothetical protein FJZ01_25440 [Candidatus Sericytochromatia bacterium]|nr:hypothetical protein [Candidatus Tanganyikabacteria bacterium]
MGVSAIGSGLETAQMMLETQITLQGKVQDMAKQEMNAILQSIAPPPSHLGRNVNVVA